VVALVAVFFLQQIQAESPAEEEALESGCLPVAELLQGEPASLPLLAAVEAEDPRVELRAVGKLQPLLGGSLKQFQVRSRNTSEEVAGK
jgi:hypothetical protein